MNVLIGESVVLMSISPGEGVKVGDQVSLKDVDHVTLRGTFPVGTVVFDQGDGTVKIRLEDRWIPVAKGVSFKPKVVESDGTSILRDTVEVQREEIERLKLEVACQTSETG